MNKQDTDSPKILFDSNKKSEILACGMASLWAV